MRIHTLLQPDPYAELNLPEPPAKPPAPSESVPRSLLGELLSGYNRAIGNGSPAVLANCSRLAEEGVSCVVTGQQLGYLGGPAYTILKAITCLLAARRFNAVPIFWLATEDHDIGEVESATFLDEGGNFFKRRLLLPKRGHAVEDLQLTEGHAAAIIAHLEELGIPGLLGDVAPGKRYAAVMARAIAALFEGEGLVFLEPFLLRRLAIPFFRDEIVEAKEIRSLLQKSVGPLKFEGEGTNLFFKDEEGVRRKVEMEGEDYLIGGVRYSVDALLDLVERRPERFSPNVAARPLLQNLLLPVAAYVGGPNELAYLSQLGAYHRFHGIGEAALLPRLSATLVPPAEQRLFSACGRSPWEPLPESWSSWFPGPENEGSEEQRERISALLAARGVPYNALHQLRNLIVPYGTFQERTLNWWHFQSKTEENLVKELLAGTSWHPQGRSFCLIGEGR